MAGHALVDDLVMQAMSEVDTSGDAEQGGSGAESAGMVRLVNEMIAEARRLRALGTGSVVTYSPKVFIPLSKLCRDVCHYCTIAQPPKRGAAATSRPCGQAKYRKVVAV